MKRLLGSVMVLSLLATGCSTSHATQSTSAGGVDPKFDTVTTPARAIPGYRRVSGIVNGAAWEARVDGTKSAFCLRVTVKGETQSDCDHTVFAHGMSFQASSGTDIDATVIFGVVAHRGAKTVSVKRSPRAHPLTGVVIAPGGDLGVDYYVIVVPGEVTVPAANARATDARGNTIAAFP